MKRVRSNTDEELPLKKRIVPAAARQISAGLRPVRFECLSATSSSSAHDSKANIGGAGGIGNSATGRAIGFYNMKTVKFKSDAGAAAAPGIPPSIASNFGGKTSGNDPTVYNTPSSGGGRIVATLRADGTVHHGPLVCGQLPTLKNYKIRTESEVANKMLGSPNSSAGSNSNNSTVVDMGKLLLQYSRDGDLPGVKNMVTRGAPFSADWLGMTPLHFAAMNDQLEMCDVLLKGGHNKDTKTKVDRTPLHMACYYGRYKITELLLTNKCVVNPTDMLRMTPLHWAVEKHHKAIVRLLLHHDADASILSKFWKTPFSIAVETEQADLLADLEAAKNRLAHKMLKDEQEKETSEAVNSIQNVDVSTNLVDDDVDKTPDSAFTDLDNIDESDIITVGEDYSPVPKEEVQDLTQDADVPTEGNSSTANSTADLLKSHGISMVPEADVAHDSQNMLNTALQNGRQLVLSEGGKLLLSKTKRPLNNNTTNGNKNPSKLLDSGPQICGALQYYDPQRKVLTPTPLPRMRTGIISRLPKQANGGIAASQTIISANELARQVNANRQKSESDPNLFVCKNGVRIISMDQLNKMFGKGVETLEEPIYDDVITVSAKDDADEELRVPLRAARKSFPLRQLKQSPISPAVVDLKDDAIVASKDSLTEQIKQLRATEHENDTAPTPPEDETSSTTKANTQNAYQAVIRAQVAQLQAVAAVKQRAEAVAKLRMEAAATKQQKKPPSASAPPPLAHVPVPVPVPVSVATLQNKPPVLAPMRIMPNPSGRILTAPQPDLRRMPPLKPMSIVSSVTAQSPATRLLPVPKFTTPGIAPLGNIPVQTMQDICRALSTLRKQNEELKQRVLVVEREKQVIVQRLQRLECALQIDKTAENTLK